MEDKSKTLILFDVGAVQVSLDFESFYRELSKLSDLSEDKFREIYGKSDLELRSAKGMTPEEYFELLRGLTSIRKEVPESVLRGAYITKIRGEIQEAIEIKERLEEAGYNTGVLSNCDKFTLDFISSEYPRVFRTRKPENRIVSCEVGFAKPDIGIYRAVPSGNFDQVIFIDDSEKYIQIGIDNFDNWKGIWFTPYIDGGEAQRGGDDKGNTPNLTDRIKIANSVGELEKSLESFGLEF